ncbi:DUF4142 domain-containing protein [Undibacterium terreum]|uniref:DUF4142 domain-containing protein n=1 Tax=Undibacterium terreum TaxID=1224302 RepID=A0A916UEA1_9BURK|nr:DUF4142 domain-containing protein [Undibacterium terreum]GGC69577.1 hypothetical protein GCM10011396_15730 [Undibacterium terreum]
MNLHALSHSRFMYKPSRKSMLLIVAAGIALIAGLAAASGSYAAAKDAEAQLGANDKQFLMTAAQAGNAEIVASKTASGKANSDAVKKFAAEMLADHGKVADELKKLAAGKGLNVPDEPSMKQQALIAKLNVLDGAKFDQLYAAEIGVAAHKEAVALFRKAAVSAKDADVKAFAQQNLPALEHHLQMAQNLKTAVGE